MRRIRPELLKGFGVLGLFLALIVATGILLPFPISQSEYMFLDLDIVRENPNLFYEQKISSKATVVTILYSDPYFILTTTENVDLQIHETVITPIGITEGDSIYFRGIFRNQTVSVHEFYVLDSNSSIIRSIPGIILFCVMFFSIFTVDLKHLAIVQRRNRDA